MKKLHIRHMVSTRCKLAVKAELDKLGISYGSVELGEVNVKNTVSTAHLKELEDNLELIGLELIDDKKAILAEKTKVVIIEMVHYREEGPKTNFSRYLSEKLEQQYTQLSTIFSEVTGTTIEHYIILQKIERAKELLLYNEHNLTEISHKLNYSSVAHLSTQFKKITGVTPTQFKKQKQHRRRISIDKL